MLEVKKESWIVVKTNSRAEKKVHERIVAQGIQSYLPMQTTVTQWSDRKKKIATPLIPSTLFVKMNLLNYAYLYQTKGVSSILKHLGKPAIVKDYEIENLRLFLSGMEGEPLSVSHKFQKGDNVDVISGPFKGIKATVIKTRKGNKTIINLESLNSSFELEISKNCLAVAKIDD